MPNITTFDTSARYIFLPVFVTTRKGKKHKFDAILDCGAPMTEFSDEALKMAGFLGEAQEIVELKSGLQTQKYGKTLLPQIEICSHPIDDLPVYVSHFEQSWGIKALIGLDFFRRFEVNINYKAGTIATTPL